MVAERENRSIKRGRGAIRIRKGSGEPATVHEMGAHMAHVYSCRTIIRNRPKEGAEQKVYHLNVYIRQGRKPEEESMLYCSHLFVGACETTGRS